MASSRDTLTRPRDRSARPAPLSTTLGPTIGPWRLVRWLGAGQWTEVYQARPESSRPEASADYTVKVLKAAAADDPQAICLLQREAFISRQVVHPHLASVLSAHVDAPPRFLVLPYLEGVTAGAALATAGPLKPPQALWIIRQASAALAAMHAAGWLHSDVKPANILVSPSGHTTLLDLGLARSRSAGQSSRDVLVGSLAYAPPEAFNPHVDFAPQSDIYCLGVTLYELLTGRLPFAAQDAVELAAAHLAQPAPDPRCIVPQLPAALSRLVRRMLAKEPLRRPAADELIEQLVELEVETIDQRVPA